jgi:hypothetical protein
LIESIKIDVNMDDSILGSISAQKEVAMAIGLDDVVAAETAKDAKTAHISLVHEAEHPSALELPIVKP